MKPCSRCVVWWSAATGAGYTGTMRFFSTRVVTSVSVDQATTSVRLGRGANGLSGLCTPAPCPLGKAAPDGGGVPGGNGELSVCADTPNTTAPLSHRPHEEGSHRHRVPGWLQWESVGVAHATVFAQGQTLAGRLEFRHADFFALAGLQAFGRALVRRGHAAVALDVFFHLLVGMLGQGGSRTGARRTGTEQLFSWDHLELRSWETSTR